MSLRNISLIIAYAWTLVSCSTSGNKYRNTENLERPPAIEINVSETPERAPVDSVATSEAIKKGLDDQVHLDVSPGASTLVINKPFEQAWFILGVLLKQLDIEITDRNRDQGYFYVRYDPDIDYSKKRGFWDGIQSMFSEDSYAERIYALKLLESFGETEVTAGIAPESEDKPEAAVVVEEDDAKEGSDSLITLLYRTLREGMAEQSRRPRRKRSE